jgi:hypothetical protein
MLGPMPHRPYPPHLRTIVLERVAAGEFIKEICGEPDMPCAESVTGWARREPEFGAALATAKARGAHRRRWAFDEARAGALLARLAAGESIGAVLADPAMPSPAVYRYWRATHGEFAEAVGRLNAVKAAEKAARMRRRRRGYDAALAATILARVWEGRPLRRVLAADPALPCLSVLARWRREVPEFDAALKGCLRKAGLRRAAGRLHSPELQEEICERIAEGATFRTLARDLAMPCAGTLSNWMRTKPGFFNAVAEACAWREQWWAEEAYGLAMTAGLGARRQIGQLRSKAGRLRGMWAAEEADLLG